MAHYSANNIKTHVSLTDYLQRIGTTLKKVGTNLFDAETCPLCGHKDCFRVEVNKDLWKCCGKTEAAGLITTLLYGQNFVTISSTASDYTDAALNPVTVCDNLELSSIVEDRKNFLLCVATGITRQKRKSGTDSQNVYEKAVTQLITTSMESFELPELIERTMVIPFSSKHFKRDYPGAVTIENHVIRHRNDMLSAVFRLTGDILNDFDAKKARWTAWLHERFPNHAKRLNEHLACMALSLAFSLSLQGPSFLLKEPSPCTRGAAFFRLRSGSARPGNLLQRRHPEKAPASTKVRFR